MKQFKMNERQRFSIRKFSIGAASVLLGSVFFVANPATEVQAAEANTEVVSQDGNGNTGNPSVLPPSDTSNQNLNVEQEGAKPNTQATERKEQDSQAKDGEGKAKVEERSTEGNSKLESNKEIAEKQDQPKTDIELSRQLNTQNLESLLSEIDAIKTENYTKESVAALKAKAEEARQVLATAQNQTEVDAAFRTLVSYKNTGLKRVKKDVEPKAPKLDTTNGKATVGLKAENTEPNGSNIAGHNHSLNGTTFTEGSGFRTAPAGDVTFSQLDGSLETEAGQAPYARFTLKFRRGHNYRPQPTTATTNGVYLDYQSQRTEGDFVNRTYVTRGSNAEVGTYNVPVRVTDSSTGEVYIQTTIKVTVKPLPPTVTVTDLEHSEGKQATVTATARNSNDSTVEFYLNGVKQKAVKAVNGSATWTPNSPFNVGDRITAVNIARDKESMTGTYGGVVNIATTTSNPSNPVTIPKSPTPSVDKSELTRETNALDGLTKEADPTVGKTTSTASAYNTAKQEAISAVNNAKTVIGNQNATTDDVSTALASVKEKSQNLTSAKTNLVEAASQDAREALKTSAEALTKASTDNKTPKSIEEYNKQYEALKTDLETAKTEALNIVQKAGDASKAEVQASQGKVDGIKARLDEAAKVLVDQANKDELTRETNALDGLTKEADPTVGKTTSTASAYNTAKQEAISAVNNAKTVIGNPNATTDDVSTALASVKEKSQNLTSAKTNLVEAASQDAREALKTSAEALTKASTDNKTPKSIEEYNKQYEALKTDLETAKTEALNIVQKAGDASKAEVQASQGKVDGIKARLDEAAKVLVDQANKDELTRETNALDGLTKEADPTVGKTTSTASAYNTAKQEAISAVNNAKTVIGNPNATTDDVSTALASVKEKSQNLTSAKTNLVEAASQDAREALKTSAEALTKASTDNKTPKSIEEYNKQYEALKTDLETAKTEALNIVQKAGDASKAEVQASQGKVDGIKARLDEAAKVLVDQANKDELTRETNALDGLTKEADPTVGKTTSTASAYNTAKQEAISAVNNAKTVIGNPNATTDDVSTALASVKEKSQNLTSAKTNLVEAASQDAREALKTSAEALTKASTDNKTPKSIEEYNKQYEALKTDLETAKTEALNIVQKAGDASKAEVQASQGKVDGIKARLDEAAKVLVDQANKDELTRETNALDGLTKEADPTVGKTTSTASAYNTAKQEAISAVNNAKTVIGNPNATTDDVSTALASVKEKSQNLTSAKTNLVEAASQDAREALKTSAEALTKASTDNKTPKSIEEYNKQYEALKTDLETAKTEALNIVQKAGDASKAEVQASQGKVDGIKARLDEAAKVLVDQANKDELTRETNALDGLTKEADPTVGKTTSTASAYNTAKQEAISAVNNAKTVIGNQNATTDDVSTALASVKEKSQNLTSAKTNLVEAASQDAREALKTSAEALTKASTDNKTPKSIEEYNKQYEALKTDLETAKTEALNIVQKAGDASKAEVQASQGKVDGIKARLDEAAKVLVDQANKDELTRETNALDGLTKEADPTVGKTTSTASAYNTAKQEAISAVNNAKTVIGNPNATTDDVSTALASVKEKSQNLTSAKTNLVEAASQDAREALKTSAEALTKASTDNKTPKSIEEYNKQYEALKTDLETAKTEALNIVQKAGDASKAEVQASQGKVDGIKARLDEAAKVLVDQANKDELTRETNALDGLTKEADPTVGKTTSTASAYNTAKQEAISAVNNAKTVIGNPNATTDDVSTALASVKEKSQNLTSAKTNLVEAASQDAREALKTSAEALTKASTDNKTPKSIEEYNKQYEALKTDLETAKTEALNIVQKAGDASKAEVQASQGKVDGIKARLDEAAKVLVDQANKDELTRETNALDGLTKEADPTVGKTTSTASAYNTAKQEAISAVNNAKTVIGNPNATTDDVSTALASVKEKSQNLTSAKTNLVEAASQDAREALKTSAEALTKASTDNKTPKSIEEYNKQYEALKTDLETAKTEALNIVQKAGDASKAEVQASQGKVDGIQARLDEAAKVLVDQANKDELTRETNALDGLTKEADPTVGKTTSTASAYNTAKQEAISAVNNAKTVIGNQNATVQDVSDEIEKLKSAMKKLQEAKDGLRDIQIPSHSTEEPTQPDQGATETPTAPSEPAPQPSQPTAPSQPASPVPAPSSAPTQAPRVAASASASSTNTQAPAQEQVDKSELRALTQELDQRLKALATVSDPKIDAAKAVLLDAQKALEDSALTEQGLRTAVESVKVALDSLKDVKANASDSKPTQDKKDAKQGTEDSKDSDKMTETNSVPAGVIVVGLLALLGVIAFWLVRRKKESEIQQLSTELTKVLGQLDAEKADKKVLAKAKKLLQETLDFVKEENGSAETEAKLVEELKATLAKLK
ncbi:Chromosome partition protein Smc [Streptococcus mitis]